MAKKVFRKIFLAAFTLLLVAMLALYHLFPLNATTQRQLIKLLQSYGLTVNSLEITSLGNRSSELSNISIGESNTFDIGTVKANYGFRQLRNQQLQNITISDINLHVYEENGKITISGLEPLFAKPATAQNKDNILYNPQILGKHLLDSIEISRLNLSAILGNIEFAGEINSILKPHDQTTITGNGKNWILHMAPYDAVIANMAFEAALDEENKQWNGTAELYDITITGTPFPIPVLQANGKFELTEENYSANFDINDTKKTATASVRIDKNSLFIKRAQFPYGGGTVSTRNITFPLGQKKKPVTFVVKVSKVDLESVLGGITGGKITGRGKLNGNFPIVIHPNGVIAINDASALGTENGTISVSPTLLAGDNQQLQMARELLQNFHYTKLGISVSSKINSNDKTAIRLTLEGNNPDALEGRQVNFNINITGDVVPLLQQSVLPFNDIKKLIQIKE